MNFFINFIKKYYKYILPVILILIISCILLTFFYKCNDLKKLNDISDKLNKINSSLSLSDFDPKKASVELDSNFDQLVDLKDELQSMDISKDKYKDLKVSLLNHINLNLNLYSNSMSALNGTNKDNFQSIYDSLLESREKLSDSACSLNQNRINIELSPKTENFFNSLNNYVDTSYRTFTDSEITRSEKCEFLLSLDDIITDFSSLKEDLKPAVSNIQSTGRDISPLVCDIKNKKSSLKNVKDRISSLSVPEDAFKCYTCLEDMMSSYEIYLNKLSFAVKKNSTSDYDDAFDKYQDFLTYYDSFIKAVDEYRKA